MRDNEGKAISTPSENADLGRIQPKRKGMGWKKTVLVIFLSLFMVLCTVGAGVYIYFKNIIDNPGSQFTSVPSASIIPLPSGDIDGLLSQADFSTMKNVVNILLVGLDYADERGNWDKNDTYNTDVMMVLTVDFNNKKVDMISLPRDTYAQIPGVQGIYKLNASMKCGGGYPKGFTKVLEAAEWMLGGVPVDYYYGVTMPVVKEIVDAIGGVTYDVDLDFTMGGRTYQKGVQHMNGQAVLDYMRVRKNIAASEAGDLNRVDRQKRMLIALFKTMQQQNLWVKLPSLISALNGKIDTNTTLGQTAALASFAYNLKEENIVMHSMGGTMASVFNMNFCLTDQAARVKLIKDIYGVTVSEYSQYTYTAAMKKWGSMMYDVYVPNANTLINYVQNMIDSATPTPALTPTPTRIPTPTLTHSPTPSPTQTVIASPTSTSTATTVQTSTSPTVAPSGSTKSNRSVSAISEEAYQKFLSVKQALSAVQSHKGGGKELVSALNKLKLECMSLASKVGHPLKSTTKWKISYKNQIDVY